MGELRLSGGYDKNRIDKVLVMPARKATRSETNKNFIYYQAKNFLSIQQWIRICG